MAAGRLLLPCMPALDSNGRPVAGALLNFYENNTTTRKAVYTSAALTTPLPNPVVADAAGVFPSIFAADDELYSVTCFSPAGIMLPKASYSSVRATTAIADGLVVVSSFMQTVLDDATQAEAQTSLDVFSKAESYTRALAVNEAPNSNFQFVPDLPEIRKLTIGAGGVPTGAVRPAATCNSITASSNTPTLGYNAVHGFRAGELIRAPVGAHANLQLCALEVLTVPTTSTLTVKLPRGLTVPLTSDANGDWTVMTRGDDGTVDVTGDTIPDRFGDLMSGDDLGKWQKNESLYVWLEDDPALLALFPGAERVWLVRKGDSAGERIFFNVNTVDRAAYVGNRRAIGMAAVRLSGSGSAAASIIQNGVASIGTACSSGARTWISHSAVVTGATLLYADGVLFTGAIGDYFAVAEFVRRAGLPPQDGEYVHRVGWIRPQGSVTAATMNGANITFGATPDANGHFSHEINAYQETNGRVGPLIKSLFWNLEGIGYVKGQIMATKEIASTTTTYGHVVTALGATLNVTSLTRAGAVATATTDEPHGQITGQTVIITGAVETAYNVTATITVTGDSTFTYAVAGAPATPATGTIKARMGFYAASRCDLNLNNHRFYLYSVSPSQSWRSVSMDINRVLA